MTSAPQPHSEQHPRGLGELRRYPLLDALTNRRARRFSAGAEIGGGGLKYRSKLPPAPLSDTEEAVLAFAASGISGLVLGDFAHLPPPGDPPTGGNVMAAMTGRMHASADSVHSAGVFVINDDGTSFLKRPQDFSVADIDHIGGLARDGDFVAIDKLLRVKLSDSRTEIPREVPYIFPFNKWDTNLPGTTYYLPVSEMSSMYLNVVFSAFDEANAFFIVDDRNNFQPAGLKKFGKSKGGALNDDPESGHVLPIQAFEALILEFVMAEQAFLAQNLSLMQQAMGLGGWTHFASATEHGWFEALGFTLERQSVTTKLRAGPLKRLLFRALGQDKSFPYSLGLSAAGRDLITPFCPPYYPTMRDAVLAYFDFKMNNITKAELDPSYHGVWKDAEGVQAQIPQFSEACLEASIAYCEYIWDTYGRFPSSYGPLRTTLASQAHHLDLEFYDTFYTPGAYTETQANHHANWH